MTALPEAAAAAEALGALRAAPSLLPLHLGALHPMETLVMAVLALGPFVILALVVTVVSRRDRRTETGEPEVPAGAESATPPGQTGARDR